MGLQLWMCSKLLKQLYGADMIHEESPIDEHASNGAIERREIKEFMKNKKKRHKKEGKPFIMQKEKNHDR